MSNFEHKLIANSLTYYTGWPPKKRNSRYSRFFRLALINSYLFSPCWIEHLFLIIITPRSSNLVENFLLWVISYGLSFSGFARFPEFQGTNNDSFSSTCASTYQHSTSYKEISVPMTCLDCKSLLGNTKELQTQATWQYTDHWTQYSLNLWTAEAVINRASELWKSGKSRKWQSIRNYSWNKKFSTKFDDLGVIIMRKRCSIQQGEKR